MIFFETKKVLDHFTSGHFEFAGGVSAVAIKKGASDSANYRDGVAVFSMTKEGLMLEAAIGGQKFSFKPN